MRKKRLSPSVIKSAIDGLPTGLAFADPTGRIILINRTMATLGGVLLGSIPQTRQEIETALARSETVARTEDDPPLFRFPDGEIWRFQTATLSQPEGFTQVSAQNVTALYQSTQRLRRDNEALRQVSREMKEMYRIMGDRVRDSETLELKMRLHNNIGASLIALTNLLEQGAGADADAQLDSLRDAVSYLTRDRATPGETLETVRERAAEMGVALRIEGVLPAEEGLLDIVAAAVAECVTNCVKHAGGDAVTARLNRELGVLTVTITNTGAPPAGSIAEGGGLGSLRDKVESGGGEMTVSYAPVFALTLRLPEGGMA